MGHLRLVLACALLGACKVAATFDCALDEQCVGGVCEPTGYCSFTDATCPSGQRYDDYAGAGLAGQCVDPFAPDAPIPPGTDGAIDATVPDATPDATPPIDAFPALTIRSNIGGPAFTGTDYPGLWSADGTDTTCSGPQLSTTSPINGTVDDALFMTSRRDPDLRCDVNGLPVGMYQVRLLFAEIVYSGCPGGGGSAPRVLDVFLELALVADNLNSDVAGGGCATTVGHPYEVQTTIPISDGNLDIDIHGVQGQGVLSAVEVVRVQ